MMATEKDNQLKNLLALRDEVSAFHKMSAKEKREVLEAVEIERFEDAFLDYDFDEIKDEKFHQLRRAYLEARKLLAKYIGHKD